MSLKYVAAYLMSVAAGKESPSKADVEAILSSVGATVDDTILSKLMSQMEGTTPHEMIAAGMTKLQSVPTGAPAGGASAATASGGAAATQEAPKEEAKEEEPEEEEDMGFSLFD